MTLTSDERAALHRVATMLRAEAGRAYNAGNIATARLNRNDAHLIDAIAERNQP